LARCRVAGGVVRAGVVMRVQHARLKV
jgi:hypothetical protein